ncbi:MAG: hypothetical protein ABW205_05345 [Burkholderiales bacterium]
MRRLAPFLALLLLAHGCGIKGPLYIPTPEQIKQAEERKQRREAAKQRDAAQAPARTPEKATDIATPEPTVAQPDESPSRMFDETLSPSTPPQ